MSIDITSPAFLDGQNIPRECTADGHNRSPALAWHDPPPGTTSLALICEDPDAPRGTFTHWVLYNLPPDARSLPEGLSTEATLPDGAAQGANGFGKVGYGGPSPPPGKPHRYYFKLYALDVRLDPHPGMTRNQLLAAMKGHVLAEGELMGKYGR
jgi:Raf kinase inhibitor-like YbhB/YbcL family protein